jgi:hypothetical protein
VCGGSVSANGCRITTVALYTFRPNSRHIPHRGRPTPLIFQLNDFVDGVTLPQPSMDGDKVGLIPYWSRGYSEGVCRQGHSWWFLFGRPQYGLLSNCCQNPLNRDSTNQIILL